MQDSRAALAREHGGMQLLWIQGDRLELRTREGRDRFLWDLQGWYGGDIDKIWFKSEGEGEWGRPLEQAEVQALWSHAIGPWFDFQAGVRWLTFIVDAVPGLVEQLRARGVEFMAESISAPDAKHVICAKGPDGMLIELVQLHDKDLP